MPVGKYRGVTLQRELINKIEEYIKAHPEMGYKSLADFITDVIREKCIELKILTTPETPPLEHFNISENGVRILDRTLANGYSRGRIVDVYFKPDRITCEYCGTDNCRHIKFALKIPKVREILTQKGWPISKRIEEE
ncbi:MAG: ribbon-helix-helix domain-containing protein [Candidatus Aenigmatarchaeota archaeon]